MEVELRPQDPTNDLRGLYPNRIERRQRLFFFLINGMAQNVQNY